MTRVSVPAQPDPLLRKASRAALWNTLFVPLLTISTLVSSVLIRRWFGLFSGVYDVLMGLAAALLQYSAMGIPGSLPKFLPEVNAASGPAALRGFLRDAVVVRLAWLALLLVPLNLVAEAASVELGLGVDGPRYIRLLSWLVAARAVTNIMVATLNSFFAQFWSNLASLIGGVLGVLLVGAALLLGFGMQGVVGSLVASATVVALMSSRYVWTKIEEFGRTDAVPGARDQRAPRLWLAGEGRRFFQFSGFVYVSGLLGFFTTMGFVAPGLALVDGTSAVALFATAFNLAFQTMNLAISGFRGLYGPVFTRLRIRDDPAQLRRAFSIVTRGQLLVLLPGALGLIIMSGDYIVLLFGDEFRPATPIAWILVAFMYGSTSLNLPGIILTLNERYRAVIAIQLIPVLSAPLFLYAAGTNGLVVAAVVFGTSRFVTSLAAYASCRRQYGLRFPWRFAARIGAVSTTMAVVVSAGRSFWSTSPAEAVTLTFVGFLVFAIGLRFANVLGPDEVDVLRRSGLPGRIWIVKLLVPAVKSSR